MFEAGRFSSVLAETDKAKLFEALRADGGGGGVRLEGVDCSEGEGANEALARSDEELAAFRDMDAIKKRSCLLGEDALEGGWGAELRGRLESRAEKYAR